jgi:hypothetical protein
LQDELKKVGQQLDRERVKNKAMARKMMEANERNAGANLSKIPSSDQCFVFGNMYFSQRNSDLDLSFQVTTIFVVEI